MHQQGQSANRYEFGVKVSLAITHKQGLIVGAKRFTGNPFDGHTLAAQITQCNGLIEGSGKAVKQAFVDLGYRGVDADNPGVTVTHRGRIKSMSKLQRKQLKRRQASEPTIGHVKHDNRMIRCHLQGSTGDALHAIACAAGYNIRWLMRAMLRVRLKGLFALFSLITLCVVDSHRDHLRQLCSTQCLVTSLCGQEPFTFEFCRDNYRSGALGRITVETPETRGVQLAALAVEIVEAEAKAEALRIAALEKSSTAR